MADTELRMTDALICLETETEGGCKKGEEFVCVCANLGGCVISAIPHLTSPLCVFRVATFFRPNSA